MCGPHLVLLYLAWHTLLSCAWVFTKNLYVFLLCIFLYLFPTNSSFSHIFLYTALITLLFDSQKNQVLLRIPDQAAYYCRQCYIYNFITCEEISTSKQPKKSFYLLLVWSWCCKRVCTNHISSFSLFKWHRLHKCFNC